MWQYVYKGNFKIFTVNLAPYTEEPPNKGHFGANSFVPCVLISSISMVPQQQVSFVERLSPTQRVPYQRFHSVILLHAKPTYCLAHFSLTDAGNMGTRQPCMKVEELDGLNMAGQTPFGPLLMPLTPFSKPLPTLTYRYIHIHSLYQCKC